jgi:DNA modification methylase
MGSGTTLFECEELDRRYIGLDINPEMIDYVGAQVDLFTNVQKYFIGRCDSAESTEFRACVEQGLNKLGTSSVQFVLMHPPYMDIVKFTEDPNDLSSIADLKSFLSKFKDVCENALSLLDKNRYFGVVIGDVYKNSEVVPLGFYVLDMIKRSFKVKLKGIVVKNIEGNRGKIGQKGIWKIRALRSDYFIFKHEYILVFKKEQ